MPRPGFLAKLSLTASVVAIAILLGLRWFGARVESRGLPSAGAAPVTESSARVEAASPATAPAPVPVMPELPPGAPTPGVALRPLAAAKESALHVWTAEDARSPEVIRRIAHNSWEERRLLDENARITGRQLVYRKEPVFIALERARAAGQPLSGFMLPGFDGRELEVEVTRADLEPSGLGGTLTGRLPGYGESIVTIAFQQGREAFSVMSPEDGTYLQGHPREPGEIILSRFDPAAYLSTPGGEPIRTNQTFKSAE